MKGVKMKEKPVKTIIKRVVIAFAIVIVIVTAAVMLYYNRMDKYKFTVEKWNEYEWNDRQLLIGDFLKQYDLNKMTRAEVIQLLGDEPDFYADYAIRYKTESNLVYDFGAEQKRNSSGNISLVITLDGQGNIVKHELVTYSW